MNQLINIGPARIRVLPRLLQWTLKMCLCSVMYIGSRNCNGISVQCSGCARGLRWDVLWRCCGVICRLYEGHFEVAKG